MVAVVLGRGHNLALHGLRVLCRRELFQSFGLVEQSQSRYGMLRIIKLENLLVDLRAGHPLNIADGSKWLRVHLCVVEGQALVEFFIVEGAQLGRRLDHRDGWRRYQICRRGLHPRNDKTGLDVLLQLDAFTDLSN